MGVVVVRAGAWYMDVFKTPVTIANTGYRKRPSQKLGSGKPATCFLNIPTSRGDRAASHPRNVLDLETPIYRAPIEILYVYV
jgi:hypothetical protein